jgi:hypothetical protein
MLFGGGVGGWMLGSGAPIKRIMHCPGDRRISEAQTRTSARGPPCRQPTQENLH